VRTLDTATWFTTIAIAPKPCFFQRICKNLPDSEKKVKELASSHDMSHRTRR